MINFTAPAIHPETGETHMCDYLDDHYGRHKYGVRFPNGDIYPVEECPEEYKGE